MPHPIPEWDVPRILVQYLGRKQIDNHPATLKEMSKRMGLGIMYLFSALNQSKVVYSCVSSEKRTLETTTILLEDISYTLALDTGISREALKASFDRLVEGKEVDKEHKKRVEENKVFDYLKAVLNKRKQEETKAKAKAKLRYFLSE